jgi:hypothetical protein
MTLSGKKKRSICGGEKLTDWKIVIKLVKKDETPAACGLEELFSNVLERFLKPIHALHVYCKN